ncbi:MAG: competence/damage-inducible protein A [Candidatus Izimaplasma sp.]|nr:competence/damage-inducible protein A [Candidatus Izimaplasma bacterium]
MKTAIITVGKEVLTGHTTNTNLQHIAERLNSIGIDVTRSFVIDDIKEEYIKILDFIDEDLIIFTGGLGPTIDDITRETVLEYFKCDTYINEEILDQIKSYFKQSGRTMKPTNHKQALVPKNGIVLKNNLGTAPGLYFKANNKQIILLPGPPKELKPQFEKALDIIKSTQSSSLISKGFRLIGIGESSIEHILKDFYQDHPKVNIAPYASTGEVKYIFTSQHKTALEKAMDEFVHLLDKYIYGTLNDTLEGVVIQKLKEKKLTLSTVESCTGGMLASRLVSVSGASDVFKEGLITYSNEAKKELVNVKSDTLKKHGAVSQECAYEMSHNQQKKRLYDVTLSITGIAGPTGGTKEKPVGLTYFGLTINNDTQTFRKIFNGDRNMIRLRATNYALNLIRQKI